ncbi:MAG: hypothetical protein AB1608_05295 [Thermoproteota archaeon]
MEREYNNESTKSEINYLVIISLFVGIIFYGFMNLYEPQIDQQFDFFELAFLLSEFVAGIFGLVVAKKYWGSEILGKAYLALGSGLIFAGIGSTLFNVLEIIYGVSNPFPNFPDIFFVIYYLLVSFHLVSCIRYFSKKRHMSISKKNKLLIILLPLVATSTLATVSFTVVNIPGSVPDMLSKYINIDDTTFEVVPIGDSPPRHQQITINDKSYELVPVEITTTKYVQNPTTNSTMNLVPIVLTNFNIRLLDIEQDLGTELTPWFIVGTVLTIFYYAMTTINLSLAIVGVQIFRNTILGNAWGLLLLGIALTAVGDLIYYLNAIQGYDRTYPDIAFWVFGYMIISYALYLHRKRL